VAAEEDAVDVVEQEAEVVVVNVDRSWIVLMFILHGPIVKYRQNFASFCVLALTTQTVSIG